MKKFASCFIIVCLLASTAVTAQKSTAILRAGLNLANVSINDNGGTSDAKTLTSFQVGIIGDFNLAPCFAIQSGLVFTGKGTKTQSGNEGDANWYRATTNPYYLEVPVNFVFKTATGPVKFFAGAGPYLAIGIAGKNKTRGSFAGVAFSSDKSIDWSNDDPTTLNEDEGAGFGIMKRFDYGLNGLVGIETQNLTFSANYGLGLAKLQSGSNSGADNNNKHRVFSLTVGFKL
jgi:hypothetical protein